MAIKIFLFVYPLTERRSSFYNLNVMIPTICTSLLVVLVFVVPEESGEKLSYVLTVFLSIAVILTLVADSMPPTSITVSVLGTYSFFCFATNDNFLSFYWRFRTIILNNYCDYFGRLFLSHR